MPPETKRNKGVVIIGTDFGVGKTLVARALTTELARRGRCVSVMKPIEVGCGLKTDVPFEIDGMPGQLDQVQRKALQRLEQIAGPQPLSNIAHTAPEALEPADALALIRSCGRELDLDLVSPFRYAAAVAPAAAARAAERPIVIDTVLHCFERLAAEADAIVVEGTGGLLQPLSGETLSIDLVKQLRLPALLVAPSRHGAVNHCLLCIEALKARGIELGGVVFNRIDTTPPSPEEAANPQLLESIAGPIVLGMLPHFSDEKLDDPQYLAERLHAHVDLNPLDLGKQTSAG